MRKIRFQDREFVLIEGALTTEQNFIHGRQSYAHLFEDGIIRRFGRDIGRQEDIEFLSGEIPEPEIDDDFLDNCLSPWEENAS